jgi:hypothetical protein
MNRCEEIIANVKMEECYAGLSLVFDGSQLIKEEIILAIEKVSKNKIFFPMFLIIPIIHLLLNLPFI